MYKMPLIFFNFRNKCTNKNFFIKTIPKKLKLCYTRINYFEIDFYFLVNKVHKVILHLFTSLIINKKILSF